MLRWSLFVALLAVGCTSNRPPPNPGPQKVCQKGPSRALPPRLLTRAEYDFTVRDLLLDGTLPALTGLPAEPLALGFENNADLYQPTPKTVAALTDLAEDVATRAIAQHKTELLPCTASDRACAQQAIASLGRRAFRRPLTDDEAAALLTLFDVGMTKKNDFDTALTWVLEAMLQSPQFLYRVEPGGAPRPDGTLPFTGYELASRLSYFLWRSMPDDELLAAAESGALDTDEGVRAQANRLLDSPKASDAMADYFRQVFSLDRMRDLEKAKSVYPEFTPALAQAWQDSMVAFTAEVAARGHLSDLYRDDAIYADSTLAPVLSLTPAPAPNGMQRFAYSHAGGLLAQPGLMAYLASPDQSSPIRRGVFALRALICQPIGDPPPNLAITIPPINANQTTRQRFDQHAGIPGCNACHRVIDPLGDGFEHFDALGRYRTRDNNLPVDSSGELVSISEQSLNGTFDGTGALAEKLAVSRQVHDCFATNTFRFALGRVENHDDECALQQVQEQFFDTGGSFRQLMLQIALSDQFRTRAAAEVSP